MAVLGSVFGGIYFILDQYKATTAAELKAFGNKIEGETKVLATKVDALNQQITVVSGKIDTVKTDLSEEIKAVDKDLKEIDRRLGKPSRARHNILQLPKVTPSILATCQMTIRGRSAVQTSRPTARCNRSASCG